MKDIIKCPQCDIPICIPKSSLFVSKRKLIKIINKVELKIRDKRKQTPGLQLATAIIIELRKELGIEHGKM